MSQLIDTKLIVVNDLFWITGHLSPISRDIAEVSKIIKAGFPQFTAAPGSNGTEIRLLGVVRHRKNGYMVWSDRILSQTLAIMTVGVVLNALHTQHHARWVYLEKRLTVTALQTVPRRWH